MEGVGFRALNFLKWSYVEDYIGECYRAHYGGY